mgnify:CR=1 FL=1
MKLLFINFLQALRHIKRNKWQTLLVVSILSFAMAAFVFSAAGIWEITHEEHGIGDDADVVIIAGCGIHNCGDQDSEHDGIHSFHVGKNAKIKYVEKHYGDGDGKGGKVMNPQTVVYLEEGATIQMDTTQIRGIDSTKRDTKIVCGPGAEAIITERLLTHGEQTAITEFTVDLDGENSGTHVVSRSVARDDSFQSYESLVNGNCRCSGHTECDAIIMDRGVVTAIPKINANSVDASLIHEAAIGKIAGEQLIKLMTLGLTEKEAETAIINGFLG